MSKLLLIDDEEDVRYSFQRIFASPEIEFATAASGEEGLKIVPKFKPDLVLMDVRMGGLNGLETLRRLRATHPKLLVILMTAYGTTQTAIEAMKLGAYDYLLKPFDAVKIKELVANALKAARDMKQVVSYEPLLQSEDYELGIVGRSEAMQRVFKLIGQIAASDATVLVTGESGTGKELVARAIHTGCGRKLGPFVAVNCAAVPETLQESELFGHERGAFTGAVQRQTGRFEEAHEGTLFLDEIAELSPSAQAKLLRVLQERRFRRVGGSEEQASDFRLVAATHRDLHAEVKAGRFREDLYFRIAVFELELPPLRARGDDVVLLAERVLARTAAQEGRALRLSEDARVALASHDWPGNVRELENAVARAVVASDGPVVELDHLPPRVQAAFERSPLSTSVPMPRSTSAPSASGPAVDVLGGRYDLETIERMAITRALARHPNNLRGVVEELGLSRTTLYRKLKQYKLEEKV